MNITLLNFKIMKTISKTIFITFLILTQLTSCKGPAGEDGMNGMDGADGADGNANVKVYRFQAPDWASSNNMILQIPDLTSEDVNFSAILVYASFESQKYRLLPVTELNISGFGSGYNLFSQSNGISHHITIFISRSGAALPNPLPDMDYAKIVIIKPSDINNIIGNGRIANPKQTVLNELQDAGIDINDYNAVCEYYGIETN